MKEIKITKPRPVKKERRGALSHLMRKIQVGQSIKCPPGVPKWPHQTVYFHNKTAQEEGEVFRWRAEVKWEKDTDGVWRDIFRIIRVS